MAAAPFLPSDWLCVQVTTAPSVCGTWRAAPACRSSPPTAGSWTSPSTTWPSTPAGATSAAPAPTRSPRCLSEGAEPESWPCLLQNVHRGAAELHQPGFSPAGGLPVDTPFFHLRDLRGHLSVVSPLKSPGIKNKAINDRLTPTEKQRLTLSYVFTFKMNLCLPAARWAELQRRSLTISASLLMLLPRGEVF